MSAINYTATEGLDLQGTEVGAWLAETTAGAATGAGASNDLSSLSVDLDATGTLTKSAVATGAGLMQFTGWSAANYLSRVYGAALDLTSTITVLAWVKPSTLTGSRAVCGNRRTGSGDYGGYGLNIEAGKLRFSVTDNAGASVHAADASDISTTNWTLAVGTITAAGLVSIYTNGRLVDTTASGTVGATAAVFAVGVENVSGSMSNAFSGGISLVRVIGSVLTAAQILEIYNNEKDLFKTNAPYRVVGTQYNLDWILEAADNSMTVDSDVVISLGGQQETIERRRDKRLDITIGSVLHTEKPTLENFLHSIQAGETFSVDVYGSVASADAPVNVIADHGYSIRRVNNSNIYAVSLSLREV